MAQNLIADQFPQWKELSIRPVSTSGWDNRTFHLGDKLLIRMPSKAYYESQVEKEHSWLPKLRSLLPIQIPVPIGIGKSTKRYPWKWSVYEWIEGESIASDCIVDLYELAIDLAKFLSALQHIDTTGGPVSGLHNFYRGGPVKVYDDEVKKALVTLENKIDAKAVAEIWEKAAATSWQKKPVWVHGDISTGNLLVYKGKLNAVIDFGQLAIGDPACDLAIAYTLFTGRSRAIFREKLKVDEDTWVRGRAWALWKALIIAADFTNPNNNESAKAWQIIDEVIQEH